MTQDINALLKTLTKAHSEIFAAIVSPQRKLTDKPVNKRKGGTSQTTTGTPSAVVSDIVNQVPVIQAAPAIQTATATVPPPPTGQ